MSRRLPAVRPQAVIKALQRGGFFVHHVTGSHHALRHAHNPRLRVTVAYHRKDMKPETLRAVIKQAGLTVEEFLDLL